MSHELVEAATDPFPLSNPAFGIEDHADIVWAVINGGGEVGDMCAFNDDAYFVPAGSTYMVQRSWSNAAAKKMQNPCVPYANTAPYFNSFPALDMISYTSDKFMTRGLQIPLGQSRTIDVNLYSNAPTKGPWTVTAFDYDSWFFGIEPNLKLSLDKTSEAKRRHPPPHRHAQQRRREPRGRGVHPHLALRHRARSGLPDQLDRPAWSSTERPLRPDRAVDAAAATGRARAGS